MFIHDKVNNDSLFVINKPRVVLFWSKFSQFSVNKIEVFEKKYQIVPILIVGYFICTGEET